MKSRAMAILAAMALIALGAAPVAAADGGIGQIGIAAQGIVLPGGTAAVVPLSYTCNSPRRFPNFFVSIVQKSASGQIVSGLTGETSPPGPICDGRAHKTRAFIAPELEPAGPGWRSGVASVTAQLDISNNQGEGAGVSAVRSVQLVPGSVSGPVSIVSAGVLARGAAVQVRVKYPCTLAKSLGPASLGYLGPIGNGLLQAPVTTLIPPPAPCSGASGTLTFRAVAAAKSWASGPALVSYPGGVVSFTMPTKSPASTISSAGSNITGGRVVANGAASLLDVSAACTPGVPPTLPLVDLWQAENDGNVVHYNVGAGFCVKSGDVRVTALPALVTSPTTSIVSEPLSPAPAFVVRDLLSGSLGSVLTLSSGTGAHSVPGLVLPTSISSLAQGAALTFPLGYTCSSSDPIGAGVTVSQLVAPHRVQSVSGAPDSPCTGQPQTGNVSLLGGPYAWQVGPAFVQVVSSAGVAWRTVPVTTSAPPG